MKGKIVVGLAALLAVLAISVYAHNSENEYRYGSMHDVIDEIIEYGSYEDLESLREEYGMPIMHWIEDEEDFELAQKLRERAARRHRNTMGFFGCHA